MGCCHGGASGQTTPEERGREIYLRGTSPAGVAITAVFGKGGPEIPASGAPCASCHGRNGIGKPEGGVTPSDLRWEQLQREISSGPATVRQRPGYTDRLLTRAITMGLDAGGTPLNPVMPQYRLPIPDARDLVAYLKTLGRQPEPGVLETTIRVGAILPPRNSEANGLSRAVREALTAYFDEYGTHERIFGRLIAIRFLELPERPGDRGHAVRAFLKDAHSSRKA